MDDMERARRISRRRMAQISFGLLVILTVVITGAILFNEDRLEIAQALATASIAMGSIMTVFVMIILAYLSISGAEYYARLGKGVERPKDEDYAD